MQLVKSPVSRQEWDPGVDHSTRHAISQNGGVMEGHFIARQLLSSLNFSKIPFSPNKKKCQANVINDNDT